MIRILLADDHSIVREGLKKLLAFEPDFQVVGEAANVDDAFTLIDRLHPDVLVLDISMPGRSGLDALPDLRRRGDGTRILVLTMHPEDMHALRSLRAGAAGYLTKDAVPEELATAIRRVHAGRKYISPELAEHLAAELSGGQGDDPLGALSLREQEVLRLLASGMKPAQIADELGVSPRTVGTYRARMLEKLRLESTADLIRFAIAQKLI
ncbi:MAG: response regulator transcription factor [Bacteroidota bacterium]|jgi:DNA-binding NarL/FixJ family response regulator|nr:response regulator transcription factor [Bacteroidota bacterium]